MSRVLDTDAMRWRLGRARPGLLDQQRSHSTAFFLSSLEYSACCSTKHLLSRERFPSHPSRSGCSEDCLPPAYTLPLPGSGARPGTPLPPGSSAAMFEKPRRRRTTHRCAHRPQRLVKNEADASTRTQKKSFSVAPMAAKRCASNMRTRSLQNFYFLAPLEGECELLPLSVVSHSPATYSSRARCVLRSVLALSPSPPSPFAWPGRSSAT